MEVATSHSNGFGKDTVAVGVKQEHRLNLLGVHTHIVESLQGLAHTGDYFKSINQTLFITYYLKEQIYRGDHIAEFFEILECRLYDNDITPHQ